MWINLVGYLNEVVPLLLLTVPKYSSASDPELKNAISAVLIDDDDEGDDDHESLKQ